MIVHEALQGASKASQACRVAYSRSTGLQMLEADFRAVCEELSDATATSRHEHAARALDVLKEALSAPIRTPADAAIKMRMSMERSCWCIPGVEQMAFAMFEEVMRYLERLGRDE